MEPIPNPGGFTQETSSPLIRRDAAGIGGAREGMPRQSRILRIASGGLVAARILMRPEQLGHSKFKFGNSGDSYSTPQFRGFNPPGEQEPNWGIE